MFHELITAFHFDVTKMSLASRIEHRKALSSAYSSRNKKNACGLQLFLPPFCSILERKKQKEKNSSLGEKVWSIGFYPSLLLTNTDW